jgi:small subunit ribosomal protein S18
MEEQKAAPEQNTERPREERRRPQREEGERGERRESGDRGERGEGGRGGDNRGGGRYRQRRIQIPKFIFKKKKCRMCKQKMKDVDYKDIDFLSKFVSDRGKIVPRRITGTCAKHQRKIKVGVKRARYMALLPFLKVEKISK